MADTNPASDRYFDLSLRLLTIFVLVSLVCCVGYLSYRWLGPHLLRTPAARVESRSSIVVSPAPASAAPKAPPEEVLMDPHKTFRCVEKGRVSFSDRACDTGSEQILPLAPPPAAPGH